MRDCYGNCTSASSKELSAEWSRWDTTSTKSFRRRLRSDVKSKLLPTIEVGLERNAKNENVDGYTIVMTTPYQSKYGKPPERPGVEAWQWVRKRSSSMLGVDTGNCNTLLVYNTT